MTAPDSTAAVRSPRSHRLADVVNDVLAPWNLAVTVPPVVGAMTTVPWPRGLALGLVTSLLVGVVPGLLIWAGRRSGRYGDKFLRDRRHRPRFLAVVTGLVVLAWVVTWALGASTSSSVFLGVMVLMAVIAAFVSRWWKISMHSMVVTGSVVLLAVLDMRLAPLLVLVPAVCWARLVVTEHTPAQLAAGALVGAVLGVVAGVA
ncbi:phosphatase PAP2 family protein [Kineococcus arenarius]|uniref:hypothetical protein n=1 Tax=Kineococcus sp. SYSU DK007 TaxID=3383128 RepID=UPI003D7CA416